MKHNDHYRNLQRLEQTVRDKLDKGWNAFSRDEMAAIVELLQGSRKARANLQQRLHTAHGEAVAWHFEGDVGLHERRPAPVGARNLFEKPANLNFVSGWRVPKGWRITGFIRTPDGMLVPARNRDPMSPNDLMRRLHAALSDLSSAYRAYEAGESSEA